MLKKCEKIAYLQKCQSVTKLLQKCSHVERTGKDHENSVENLEMNPVLSQSYRDKKTKKR